MTEIDEPTVFAPGFGTLLASLALFVGLIIFQAYRPTFENEKKYRTATIFGLLTLISFIASSFDFLGYYKPLILVCINEFNVGIALPCLYISGKPNLKTYIHNVISMKIGQPLDNIRSNLNVLKQVFRTNRIEQIPTVQIIGLQGNQPQDNVTLP